MDQSGHSGLASFPTRSALSFSALFSKNRAALAAIKADLGRLRIKSALRTGYWWLANEA